MRKIKFVSAIFFCTIAFSATAKEITCPSITQVRNAATAIDAIKLEYGTTYSGYTSKPAFRHKGLDWKIQVSPLSGTEDYIINEARRITSKVIYRGRDIASEIETKFSCYYSWTFIDIVSVYAEK